MIRLLPLAAFTILSLTACGGTGPVTNASESQPEAGNISVEDLPSDGLAAPADTPLESESDSLNDASGNSG